MLGEPKTCPLSVSISVRMKGISLETCRALTGTEKTVCVPGKRDSPVHIEMAIFSMVFIQRINCKLFNG